MSLRPAVDTASGGEVTGAGQSGRGADYGDEPEPDDAEHEHSGRGVTSPTGAHGTRRPPGPALVRFRKRRDFLVAEEPCDLRDRRISVGKVAIRELVPQPGEERRKGQSFLAQSSCQRSLAEPEPARDLVDPR